MLNRIRRHRRKSAGMMVLVLMLSLLSFSAFSCMAAVTAGGQAVTGTNPHCDNLSVAGIAGRDGGCMDHCLASGVDSGADQWPGASLGMDLPVVIVSLLLVDTRQPRETFIVDAPPVPFFSQAPEEHRVLRI